MPSSLEAALKALNDSFPDGRICAFGGCPAYTQTDEETLKNVQIYTTAQTTELSTPQGTCRAEDPYKVVQTGTKCPLADEVVATFLINLSN